LTPHVSLRHFLGAELRHWRQVAGLSHARLGELVNYSGALIAKVEKAERTPTAALAQACDQVLGTGGVLSRLVELVEALDQQDAAASTAGQWPDHVWLLIGRGPTVGAASARGADPVNRFEFLMSVFGAGAGSLLGSESEAARLGAEDVANWQRSLARFYELDDQYGGGAYELALRSLRQLRRVLHRASYSPSTGDALHALAGELTNHTGWLAFDSGWQVEARYWWLDASHTARLNGDDRGFVAALRLLSRQASELDRPRDAVEHARAAQQAARSWATPRLRSHLLSVEAFAHSHAKDERATWGALRKAGELIGSDPHDDDPSWLYFWDEADLACCEARAAQALGQLPLAERRIDAALSAVRPEYLRNRVGNLVCRTEILVEQRSIEEAVSSATQAVLGASDVSSARLDARIGQVRAELSRYSDQPKVAEFLDWSGQIMAAKTNYSMV
jgi:transcriptional regulator with XRE-family HTH domain